MRDRLRGTVKFTGISSRHIKALIGDALGDPPHWSKKTWGDVCNEKLEAERQKKGRRIDR